VTDDKHEEAEEQLPLHDEAQARAKWRGGETLLEGGSDDLGLPASEVDNAKLSAGDEEKGDGRPGQGRPGDFLPPD
jgi:hypothetical protein